jgi:Lipocalin-like domain
MENSLKEKIIGAWRLVSFEQESKDGKITFPLGKDARGYLYYLIDGHVSVHIMRTGRQISLEDGVLKYNELGYLAYGGHYYFDETRMVMTHEVDVSLYPEWTGTAQVRKVDLKWPYLQLSSDGPVGEEGFQFRLRWLRD